MVKSLSVILLCFFCLFGVAAAKKKVKLKDIKADLSVIYSDETKLYRSPQYPGFDDKTTVKLRTAKNDIDKAALKYKTVSGESYMLMYKKDSDKYFDYYYGVIPPTKEAMIYCFELTKGEDVFYYARNGINVKDPSSSMKFKIFPGFKTPEWMKGAVLYQIYIDRFYNGNKSNDVVTNEYMYDNYPVVAKGWDELPDSKTTYKDGSNRTREFFGGDIDGVIQKLPYLKSLGIDGIYFNPLFVSPSNHKYDAADYENIDPHLGVIVEDADGLVDPSKDPSYKSKDFNRASEVNKTAKKFITRVTSQKNLDASNKKLKELIDKANALGIKVILDGVFNHCGSFNKWLDREHIYPENGAYETADSKYNKYFKFKEDKWPNNESYEDWWGYKTLPKLNYEDSPELYNKIMDISKKWVKEGIAGWRLDVASDLGHTAKFNHKFWADLRKSVKGVNPDAVVFAEVYGDASAWLKGEEWDTVMNYDSFFEPITFYLTGMEKHSYSYNGKLHNNALEFDKIMKETMAKMPWQSLEIAMNQLSNHDHSRFITRTNNTVDEGKDNDVRKPELAMVGVNKGILKEATVFQMTWMGAPTLYYGDEAGLGGWTDPDDRRTYPWGKEDNELIEFNKKIIKIHKQYSSISDGSTITLIADNATKVYSYGRWNNNDFVITALNNDSADHDIAIKGYLLGLSSGDSLNVVFRSDKDSHSDKTEKITVSDKGTINVKVKAYGTVIIAGVSKKEPEPAAKYAMSVVKCTPSDKSSNGALNKITIEFSDIPEKNSVLKSVSVSGGAKLTYAVSGKTLVIYNKAKFKKGKYDVVIGAGLKTLFGSYELGSDYKYSFEVK